MGLVGGADGDVQEVTGLETDCYSVQFVVDGAFENEEELVTVGVEVARVGCTGLESDVTECHFRSGGESAVGQPLDGSPVGALGYALAEVDDARFDRRGVCCGHWDSPGLTVSVNARYPAGAWRRGDVFNVALVGWASSC